MELRHLRYFVAVAEELNFTRAAARLRVAQPALSSQVKDLETELETPLFERRHSGVQLTRAGKTFYRHARAILDRAAEAANEARTAGGVITGTLVLGFPSGLHLNFLAPVIGAFRKAHPKVEFEFSHALPATQLKLLREGRLDIGFVNAPVTVEGLEHQVIWRWPFKVVLPQRHPLARQKSFRLADLQGEDFVFCTRESRPEFYDDFFRRCANAGFQPRVVKEVGRYPTNVLGLISVGAGLSVLPHIPSIERIRGIAWRPLTEPRWWAEWALAWRRQEGAAVAEQFVASAEARLGRPGRSEQADF